MITKTIAEAYELPIPAKAATAVKRFLEENDLKALPCGRYHLIGDSFVNIQECSLSPQKGNRMEYHERYADIQCVISGTEGYLFGALENCRVTDEYSPERDVAFIEAKATLFCSVSEGIALYFPPLEPHFACLIPHGETGGWVKKAVFKIDMNG